MIDCERYWTVLQKMQCKTSTNVLNLVNVYVFNIGSICIHGKEVLRNFYVPSKNTGNNLTVKQMFDISEKLIVGTIRWDFLECDQSTGKILHGNNFLRSMKKKSSVYRMQRFMYFQILCYVLERWIRTQHKNIVWEENLSWFKDSPQYRTLDTSDGEPMEFEWNIFPGFTTHPRSPKVHETNERSITNQRTNYLHVDVQRHHMEIWRQWTGMQCQRHVWSIFAKRCPAGRWSFLGHGSEKKWYSTSIERPRGEWDRVAELMMIKFRESGHPVFRASSPLPRGTLKSKGCGQLSIHFCADGIRLKLIFAQLFLSISSVSTEQFQTCMMNTVPVKQERRDPCWPSNLTHCSRQQTYW